jgi:tellurium resistance protein TerD
MSRSGDILDTSFEDKDVVIDDGFVSIGDDINLAEKDYAMHKLIFGMGWDLNAFDGEVMDADMSLFMLDKNEQTRIDEDFIFYNNLMALDGAVKHYGDSRTGAGDGDDEVIALDLHGIPFDIIRIMVVFSIYNGHEKDQFLGSIRNAYFRIVNQAKNTEVLRFNMHNHMQDNRDNKSAAMIVGYLDREGPKWHFRPTGEFVPEGLGKIARDKGLVIIQQ